MGPNQEKTQTNLLQFIINKRELLNPHNDSKSVLNRLIFVSKLSWQLADKRDLAELWVEHFQKYNQTDSVTGLLLLYPLHTIHIIESSSDVIYCVLRDLCETRKPGVRNLVLEPRILIVSHNIPERLFSQWSFKVLDFLKPQPEVKYTEESTYRLVRDSLRKLLQLSKHIAKYPKGSMNIPDIVFVRAPDLVIPESSIVRLLQCTDLLTPQQFLEAYDSPVNVLMDSGHVFGSFNQTSV
ncbi:testis-expressed protein 47-like isoform 2-T2 [Discoglossus pictus]